MDINQNLSQLMKEAQKMQSRMQEAQEELTRMVVTGEAGGGLVKVTMNGRHEVLDVKISPKLMGEDEDDLDMLNDLVKAACNKAAQDVEAESKKKIANLTQGLNIPTDFMRDEK